MKRYKILIFVYLFSIILSFGCGVYATNIIMAREVTYTSAETSKTNVQDAIDELYEKAFIHIGGMEVPVLKDGMIPIRFSKDGKTLKASVGGDWYDYHNMKWANAVSVTSGTRNKYQNAVDGTEILEEDILGYFVWIPRYRYQLWNAENGTSNEQEIKIEFERVGTKKSNGTRNGEWLTHPAFTFGNLELKGFWVGKFETTGSATNPTIKPNMSPAINVKVAEAFYASKKLSTDSSYGLTDYDAHLIKNSEWGAVAYLSHSKYGKNSEVWINNTYITGCAGSTASASYTSSCSSEYKYTKSGINASTTGNITGIYDMAGGVWEFVMANITDNNKNMRILNSGFTSIPDSKYYDAYSNNTSASNFQLGKLGDATKEILKTANVGNSAWYQDASQMPTQTAPWFKRGGYAYNTTSAGIFRFVETDGSASTTYGFRIVIS